MMEEAVKNQLARGASLMQRLRRGGEYTEIPAQTLEDLLAAVAIVQCNPDITTTDDYLHLKLQRLARAIRADRAERGTMTRRSEPSYFGGRG